MPKRTSKSASQSATATAVAAVSARPLRRQYDAQFKVTPAYRASLPDVMQEANTIKGGHVPIQQVGVSGFRLPLRFRVKGGGGGREGTDARIVILETSVTGTVSVEAASRGINMSRIVRSFYEHENDVFTHDLLKRLLAKYRREVGAHSARLRLAFSYPIKQHALRSGLAGWQYYDVVFEGRMDEQGVFRKFVEFDFVYSSACPCSAALAEHAREVRGVYALGHNQRSRARIRVEVAPRARLSPEDLQQHCVRALRTETQVMVRREDEQAFAELNGANLKFVEDAARLLFAALDADRRIVDFEVACSHLESLHSHDAVSVICKGVPGGFAGDFADFRSLVC